MQGETMLDVTFPAPPEFPAEETAARVAEMLRWCFDLSWERQLRLLVHQCAELDHERFVTIVRALYMGLATLDISERNGVAPESTVKNYLSQVARAERIVESLN